ncbi:hypothetical protein ZWY2020_013681 [Hordeum vulgare]|nr:hypothetical protein ZWY2020_013681 [Hordeum vulgare]
MARALSGEERQSRGFDDLHKKEAVDEVLREDNPGEATNYVSPGINRRAPSSPLVCPFARRSSILLDSIPSTNRDTPRRTDEGRLRLHAPAVALRFTSAAASQGHGDRNKNKSHGRDASQIPRSALPTSPPPPSSQVTLGSTTPPAQQPAGEEEEEEEDHTSSVSRTTSTASTPQIKAIINTGRPSSRLH